ncbi:hypothetical protein [Micromonospora musae]|nr:hypothetical protein [Micromonospora musae]
MSTIVLSAQTSTPAFALCFVTVQFGGKTARSGIPARIREGR